LAGDCAIGSILNRDYNEEIIELAVIPTGIADVELGDKVVKSGRTTGVTYGIVSRINVTTKINYGGSIGERTISCFEMKPNPEKPPENGEISMGGDSGSVWLIDSEKDNGLVVGLHFAGESDLHRKMNMPCHVISNQS
jgi:endonuclease G